MRPKKDFALRELLVIMGILAILAFLATLLVPPTCRATKLREQVECRANLNGIGKAIALYRGEMNDTRFPLLWTKGQPESNITASDPAASLEELKTKLIGREAAMQNAWIFIDKGLVSERAFGCPADEYYQVREFSDPSAEAAGKFGWQSAANFSYGMHFPYESTTIQGRSVANPAHLNANLNGSFVIMADKNPSRASGPSRGVGPDNPPSNHKENGENYLMCSGAVSFKASLEDSHINGDDIYTIEPANNADPATPAGLDDQYIVKHPAYD